MRRLQSFLLSPGVHAPDCMIYSPRAEPGFFPGRYLSEFYIQLLLLHMVFLSVSCQKQGQGTVARYIAGGSEAVLQSKDG